MESSGNFHIGTLDEIEKSAYKPDLVLNIYIHDTGVGFYGEGETKALSHFVDHDMGELRVNPLLREKEEMALAVAAFLCKGANFVPEALEQATEDFFKMIIEELLRELFGGNND